MITTRSLRQMTPFFKYNYPFNYCFLITISYIILFSTISPRVTYSSEISEPFQWYGCEGHILDQNGHIITDNSIDFSSVSIQLLTPEGQTKQSVHCSPNGFYSIPIDDTRRSYILNISGPMGWSFSPSSFKIDKTCQNNINFVFDGFSVSGQVLANNSYVGPRDILISLQQNDGSILTTYSSENGTFIFENIFPGKITLDAKSQIYKLSKDLITSEVLNSNLALNETFLIDGYPFSAIIKNSDGKYTEGLIVSLSCPFKDISGHKCLSSGSSDYLNSIQESFPTSSLCPLGNDNFISYPSLPIGQYSLNIIIPELPDNSYNFEMNNSSFQIFNNPVELFNNFTITQFPLQGKVLTHLHSPIPNAKIMMDTNFVAISDSNGTFHINHIKTGYHSFTISVPHFTFDVLSQIYLSYTPKQEIELFSSAYDVCGTIYLPLHEDKQEYVVDTDSNVSISSEFYFNETSTNSKGQFCFSCSSGNYSISLSKSQQTKFNYLTTPREIEINVTDKPYLDLDFYKQFYTLNITVSSLQDHENTSYKFNLTKFYDSGISSEIVVGSSSSQYNITPGLYHVSILNDKWCFQEDNFQIETGDNQTINIEFIQSGYLINGNITDNASYNIKLISEKVNYFESFHHKKGTFSYCLPFPGSYLITPTPCYNFHQESYTLNTSLQSFLNIEVKNIRLIGKIDLSDLQDSKIIQSNTISVAFVDKDNIKISEDFAEYNPYQTHASYTLSLPTNQEFGTIKPFVNSNSTSPILFFPPYESFSSCTLNQSGCYVPPTITARLGTTLPITFDTTLQDIEISVIDDEFGDVIHQQKSNVVNSQIQLGPFYTNKKYSIIPKLPNYNFSKVQELSFSCIKVSSIEINFFTTNNNKEVYTPLTGALVLLTSLNDPNFKERRYLKNFSTTIYRDLLPGNYFIQPLLKEYQFDPSQMSLKLNQDENVKIDWTAYRVAYSCYGRINYFPITNFNFSNIVVEAQSDSYTILDTLVETDGTYCLKGLSPNSSYILSLRLLTNENDIRISPLHKYINIQHADIHEINFGLIKDFQESSIKGIIVRENYRSPYTIELFKDNDSQPIATRNSYIQPYFEFRGLLKGNYTISVTKGLKHSRKKRDKDSINYSQSVVLDKEVNIEIKIENFKESLPRGSKTTQKTNPWVSLIILAFFLHLYLRSTGTYKNATLNTLIAQFLKKEKTFSEVKTSKRKISKEKN